MNKAQTTVYKGVAILLVILCHAMGTFGHGITLFTPLGGIGVSVFLLLSAYGLNESWLATSNGGGYTTLLVEKAIYNSLDSVYYCSAGCLLAFT